MRRSGCGRQASRLGAQLTNSPGAWNFSDLHTSDPSAAAGFYEQAFGWRVVDQGWGVAIQVPGYGDHLEATVDPDIRARQGSAPEGFEDVIGGAGGGRDGEPSHWHVTFTVADRDASAEMVERLGGQVLQQRQGRLDPQRAGARPPGRGLHDQPVRPEGVVLGPDYDWGMSTTVDLPLLPLGRGKDLSSERGVECPGDLPAASDPDLVARARAAKEALGERVFVLGHHYQRDEVIQFADVTGDSFKLARDAAARPEAEYIVFCGVHFMAESADILTSPEQKVILPDLAAGCSMADMARLAQVEDAWDAMTEAGVASSVVPITYMNSSADIKAFCGRNGGAVCTSSNAEAALEWAFAQHGPTTPRCSSSPTSTSAATPPCSRWA